VSEPSQLERHFVIVGGGISGLAAAHRTGELQPRGRITLLEAGQHLGGVLDTERRDGYLIERSADMFAGNPPWALDLCRRIGFREQLLPTNEARRRAFIVRRGRLVPVPDGFLLMQPKRCLPLLRSPLLSVSGKLRLLGEYFVPPRKEEGDESLASFTRRRLGNQAFERLVQPLIGGIYTADPEKLSMAATMPRFLEMERRHGSLIRAARAEAAGRVSSKGNPTEEQSDSGARYAMFMAPRGGMASLVKAIADALPADSIRCGCTVTSIRPRSGSDRWEVEIRSDDGKASESLPCDGVILALRASNAAELVAGFDAELARELCEIPYAGSSVVTMGYRRDKIRHALDGFGFVVPRREKRRILAGSFASNKFPGRAPDGEVLIRIFIGGALQPEFAELPDEELRTIACEELSELIGAEGKPRFAEVVRWRAAMPQYHVGHLERVNHIEALAAAHPGLALCGAAYRGVGIPQSIRSGELAAERVAFR